MMTLIFSADYIDTVNVLPDVPPYTPSHIPYTNIMLTGISPANGTISRISQSNIPQFQVSAGVRFTVTLPYDILLARSLSFNQLKSSGVLNINDQYISGPTLSTPGELNWLLYSAIQKSPVKVLNTSGLPDVDLTGTAIVKLVPTLIGSADTADAYYEYRFLEGSLSNNIVFQQSPNNNILATRIYGIGNTFTYIDTKLRMVTKPMYGSVIDNVNLTFN